MWHMIYIACFLKTGIGVKEILRLCLGSERL
jgi:hypothetical protein